MKLEAKITFITQYDVDLQWYNGATTTEEIIAIDLEGAKNDPLEFLNLGINNIQPIIKIKEIL